nr:Ig domain-containing protein [Clostridia bacterium]
MKKRIISLVLSIVLLFSMLPFNVFAEESEILSSIVSNVQGEEVDIEETENNLSQNEINESEISVIEEDTAGDQVQENKAETENDTEPGNEEEIPAQNNEDPVAVDDSKEEPQIVSAESIIFEDNDIELCVGDSYLIKYSVLPDDTSDKSVEWTSSNEAIATVDDGIIKALSKGTAVITAST